jgi:hypothetical protein
VHLGYILILDAASGAPIDTIRTVGLSNFFPEEPMSVRQIVFHRTDHKAYVPVYLNQPGLLVIDTDEKELISTRYASGAYTTVFEIAIAPD